MKRNKTSPLQDFLYAKILLPLSLRRGDEASLLGYDKINRGEVNTVIKLFSLLFCILLISSCGDQEYLHHKIKFEKIADNCSGLPQSFQMNSNINGERYEFNKCLDENFESTNTTYSRHGDTLEVHFKNKQNVKQSEFHITLDIDTYPRYNFLTIDGDTFIIVPTSG